MLNNKNLGGGQGQRALGREVLPWRWGFWLLAVLIAGLGAGFFKLGAAAPGVEIWMITLGGVVFNLVLGGAGWKGLWEIGWKRAVGVVLILSIWAWIIESIGLKTCWPYGCFNYGQMMGPFIDFWGLKNSAGEAFALAPWSLPLAYLPMVLSSYAMGEWLVGWVGKSWSGLGDAGVVGKAWSGAEVAEFSKKFAPFLINFRKILGAVLILLLMDLLIDPLALRVGLWSYVERGLWFGVPLSNFVGWMISGIISMSIINLFLQRKIAPKWWVWQWWVLMVFWIGIGFGLVLNSCFLN